MDPTKTAEPAGLQPYPLQATGVILLLGTTVNAVAVTICALLGWRLGSSLPHRYRDWALAVIGLAVVGLGLREALGTEMPLLILASTVVGAGVGTWLNLAGAARRLAARAEGWLVGHLQGRVRGEALPDARERSTNTGQAAVTASLLFCVGPLAILGGLEGGIAARHDLLLAKSVLDGVSAFFLAAAMGPGVAAAAVPVFLYQGLWVAVGTVWGTLLSDAVIQEFSACGGVIIAVIGLNLLGVKSLPAVNLLPALLIAPAAASLLSV